MTMLHKMGFRSLADQAKRDVDRAARKVRDPEGDVDPTLYLCRRHATHRIEIPRQWFSSREAKDTLVEHVISSLIRIGGVTLVAMQMTMFMSQYDMDELTPEQLASAESYDLPEGIPMPSQDPRRVEYVTVHVFDAEIRETWAREISRTLGRPPVFGRWEKMPDMVQGLMIDPIAQALR